MGPFHHVMPRWCHVRCTKLRHRVTRRMKACVGLLMLCTASWPPVANLSTSLLGCVCLVGPNCRELAFTYSCARCFMVQSNETSLSVESNVIEPVIATLSTVLQQPYTPSRSAVWLSIVGFFRSLVRQYPATKSEIHHRSQPTPCVPVVAYLLALVVCVQGPPDCCSGSRYPAGVAWKQSNQRPSPRRCGAPVARFDPQVSRICVVSSSHSWRAVRRRVRCWHTLHSAR